MDHVRPGPSCAMIRGRCLPTVGHLIPSAFATVDVGYCPNQPTLSGNREEVVTFSRESWLLQRQASQNIGLVDNTDNTHIFGRRCKSEAVQHKEEKILKIVGNNIRSA